MIQKVKNLVLSKGKNIPCVWEEKKKDGSVTLICDMNGRRKTPIFMQKESQQQALIPVRTRDIIVTAKKKDERVEFVIYGIKSINPETLETELIVLNKTNEECEFENGHTHVFSYHIARAVVLSCINGKIPARDTRLRGDKRFLTSVLRVCGNKHKKYFQNLLEELDDKK